MDNSTKNDMYFEFVKSSLTADLNAKGYHVLNPQQNSVDWIVSKPKGKAFGVQFRPYKDLRYFFNSKFSKENGNAELFGQKLPVIHVGVDSKKEQLAVERFLARKLGSYASRLNLREYVTE